MLGKFLCYSDKEILDIVFENIYQDSMTKKPYVLGVIEDAFESVRFPFFSRKRAAELYEWVEDHQVYEFLLSKGISLIHLWNEPHMVTFYLNWIDHLIKEIENGKV